MGGEKAIDLSAMVGNPDFQRMIAMNLGSMMGANSGLAKEYFEGLPEVVKQRVEVRSLGRATPSEHRLKNSLSGCHLI